MNLNASNPIKKHDFVPDPVQPKHDFVPDEMQPSISKTDAESETRPVAQKAGRLAFLYGLGRAVGSTSGIAYELGVTPASSPSFYTNIDLERLGNDIEYLYEKNLGKPVEEWSEKDREFYNDISKRIQQPEEISKQFEGKGIDLSLANLASKLTGVSLHPEDVLEKAAWWTGIVKDRTKVKEVLEIGLKPKELLKAIAPYPTEVFRGIGAGTAMQMAEDGQWGPLGTLAAVVAGDIVGHAPKAFGYAITHPKETMAQATNILTMNNTRRLAAQQLSEDFAKSNIQIDAGTLTQSPLVQMIQARLSQSGLVGDALDNFRKELSDQIVREYEKILENFGELNFENNYQASEAINRALRVNEVNLNIPKGETSNGKTLVGRVAAEERPDYQQTLLDTISSEPTPNDYQGGLNIKTAAEDIRQPLKEEFTERWTDFNQKVAEYEAGPQTQLTEVLRDFVDSHRGSLLLGESSAEARVLGAAERLLAQLVTDDGAYRGVSLGQLIKTKRTLGDVANYEMHGSDFTSAYKQLVSNLDDAIHRILVANPELQNEFLHLNADYSAFKSTFENKNLEKVYNPQNHNYNTIYNEFISSPDKLRSLEDIFYNSERGEQILDQIKRDYAQRIIEKPNLSARDIQNLQQVLGPQYNDAILDFMRNRQQALERPLPRIIKGEPLGIEAPISQTQANKPIAGRKVSETGTEAAKAGVRKKMADALKGKTSDEVMREMDTIEGIRRLRKALETTTEGKQLFKELSRFKLAQIIDKKMTDSVTQQVNLGTFSKLLDNRKTKDIIRELIGNDAYTKLERLQKNAGQLAKSAAKFYNASKSGTTWADVSLIGAAISGLLAGNPYVYAPAATTVGGSRLLAHLLSDKVFLKELEKAIYTNYPKKFKEALMAMRHPILQAQNLLKEEEQEEE